MTQPSGLQRDNSATERPAGGSEVDGLMRSSKEQLQKDNRKIKKRSQKKPPEINKCRFVSITNCLTDRDGGNDQLSNRQGLRSTVGANS